MTRSAAGDLARYNGRSFEGALDAQHKRYARSGVSVVRLGPPVEPVKIGARLLFRATGPGPVDYLAVAGAMDFVFDAKSTAKDYFPLNALPEHQARYLDEVTAAATDGHVVGGLVVRVADLGAWWLPWRALAPLWWAWFRAPKAPRGTASLTLAQLHEVGRRLDGVEWLSAASAMALEAK